MNIIKLVAIIALTIVVLLYSLLHYYISFFATIPIFTLLYWLANRICILITFPASSKLYYKFVLSNVSLFYAKKILQRSSIIANTYNNHPYPNHIVQEAILYLHQQYQIFTQMDHKSHIQTQYHQQLKKVTDILLPNAVLSNENKQQIKDVLKNLMNFLEDHIQQTQNKSNYQFYKAQEFLGTLKERRLYILLSNPKAQRLIIKNEGISLDVLHIRSCSSDAPTVLYCHPNAGFYEYAYQDCDWFKFYRTLNYNIITWNYRSFGSSEGTVSPQNCITDAEYLVDYFRKEFGYQVFGIHGHSLGGMIASEVAYSKNMSFLIADRTFSSLGQTASKMLGSSAARFVFQLVTKWDKPNYLKYYNYSGPKLIIQDTSDEMIPYTSQLQTSIVRCYFTGTQEPSFANQLFDQESDAYMNFFYNRIINQVEMTKFCENLESIIKIFIKTQNQDNQQNNNAQYIELVNDDQLDRLFIQDLSEIFCNIHYNENTLFRVLLESRSQESIALFFGSCFTFGQSEGQFLQDYKIFEKEIIKYLSADVQMKQELTQIIQTIGKIVDKFSQLSQELQTGYTNEQDVNKNAKLGELLAVFCGHNNNLSESEANLVVHFLRKNKLIIQ